MVIIGPLIPIVFCICVILNPPFDDKGRVIEMLDNGKIVRIKMEAN